MQNEVGPLPPQSLPQALALVWRVFSRFEAPEYSPEGVEEFKTYIQSQNIQNLLAAGTMTMWGCWQNETLTGVLACRPAGHISLLFVDPAFHRQGVARALVEHMEAGCRAQGLSHLTVNSSPYAQEAYRHLGYRAAGEEQCQNGIRFFPMEKEL